MHGFDSRDLAQAPVETAPDGSTVRVLLAVAGGSMAHFELAPGMVSRAVRHRSVDELWYIISGHGAMWREQGADDDVQSALVALRAGVCLSIPAGTAFQFRASDDAAALCAVAVTMPPWRGVDATTEAEFVTGNPAWPDANKPDAIAPDP